MQEYAPEDIIYGPYAMNDFQPDVISKCLGYLSVDNMVLLLQASTFETEGWPIVKWYETPYSSVPISEDFLLVCLLSVSCELTKLYILETPKH